jgi:hypothetical protein
MENSHKSLKVFRNSAKFSNDSIRSSMRSLVRISSGEVPVASLSLEAGCCYTSPATLLMISRYATNRIVPNGKDNIMGSTVSRSGGESWSSGSSSMGGIVSTSTQLTSVSAGVEIMDGIDNSEEASIVSTISSTAISAAFSSSRAGVSAASLGRSKPRAELVLHTSKNDKIYQQNFTMRKGKVLGYLQCQLLY